MTDAVQTPTLPPEEALTQMRRLATAVLGLMAAIFLATHFAGDGATVHLVRSMAEAGIVGGLADWFAVEALFRHPLGLPIPHTALLPRNQASAAKAVGRFFETHFLDPETLADRLRQIEPGRRVAEWLAHPDNAALVARELTGLLGSVLHSRPFAARACPVAGLAEGADAWCGGCRRSHCRGPCEAGEGGHPQHRRGRGARPRPPRHRRAPRGRRCAGAGPQPLVDRLGGRPPHRGHGGRRRPVAARRAAHRGLRPPARFRGGLRPAGRQACRGGRADPGRDGGPPPHCRIRHPRERRAAPCRRAARPSA